MTVVLQHQYWDLAVTEHSFEVGLSFGGIPERLLVPFEAVKGFFDPSVQFGLQFEVAGAEAEQGETGVREVSPQASGEPVPEVRPAGRPAESDTKADPAAEPAAGPGGAESSAWTSSARNEDRACRGVMPRRSHPPKSAPVPVCRRARARAALTSPSGGTGGGFHKIYTALFLSSRPPRVGSNFSALVVEPQPSSSVRVAAMGDVINLKRATQTQGPRGAGDGRRGQSPSLWSAGAERKLEEARADLEARKLDGHKRSE